MGCDRAQSFMLAGPAPAISIQALLAARSGAGNLPAPPNLLEDDVLAEDEVVEDVKLI